MAEKFVRLDEVIERLGLQNLTPSIDPHGVKIYHRLLENEFIRLHKRIFLTVLGEVGYGY